jgi:hypothetical protein
MSYNPDPTWTNNIVLPSIELMRCPTCGHVASNAKTVMDILCRPDYYSPRHIPPYLIFTCANPDCPNCDNDFLVELCVVVYINGAPVLDSIGIGDTR